MMKTLNTLSSSDRHLIQRTGGIMYTLYYVPDACSLATQTVLRELNQDVQLMNKQAVKDFTDINPVDAVPVIHDGKQYVKEGAAVMIHLLQRHPNTLFPNEKGAQLEAIQDIMFANATMHPAYSRLFFIAQNVKHPEGQEQAYQAAQSAIEKLWHVVEARLNTQPYLGGKHYGAADIMLAVYSRWGAFFPVDIHTGERTTAMLNSILALPSFQASLQAEKKQAA